MDDVLDKALNNEKNNSIIKLNTSKIDKIKNKILDELNITNQYKNILLDKLKYQHLLGLLSQNSSLNFAFHKQV
jgi:hypothetical protein